MQSILLPTNLQNIQLFSFILTASLCFEDRSSDCDLFWVNDLILLLLFQGRPMLYHEETLKFERHLSDLINDVKGLLTVRLTLASSTEDTLAKAAFEQTRQCGVY